MPTEHKLLQWSFGVQHHVVPLHDDTTGEPVMLPVPDGAPEGTLPEQATSMIHKVIFADHMGSGDVITCDLPEPARGTLLYQLISDLMLDDDGNVAHEGEPAVLRLLRETHESVLAHRQAQAAAQAGLVVAGPGQLPNGDGPLH